MRRSFLPEAYDFEYLGQKERNGESECTRKQRENC